MDKNKSVGQWPNPHLQDRLHNARLIVEAFIQRFCPSRGILSWICVCAGLKEVFPAGRWVIRGLEIWSRFWEVTVIGGLCVALCLLDDIDWTQAYVQWFMGYAHGKYVPFIWTCTRLCWMSCRPDRWPTLWCWKNGHDSWYNGMQDAIGTQPPRWPRTNKEGFIGRTKKKKQPCGWKPLKTNSGLKPHFSWKRN